MGSNPIGLLLWHRIRKQIKLSRVQNWLLKRLYIFEVVTDLLKFHVHLVCNKFVAGKLCDVKDLLNTSNLQLRLEKVILLQNYFILQI